MAALLLLGFVAGLSAWAEPDWAPARTWVFVVGVLEWESADLAPFPKKKRRDRQLVNFFAKAGVPDGQMVYLQDSEATLANIEARLADFLPRAGADDLLVVYYCGHGYPASDDPGKVLMASHDASHEMEGWAFEALVDSIEARFRGRRALLLADCCHAGGAVRAVKAKGARVAYACLGSAAANDSSTANWTFTESILAAWRGNAAVDLNEDGAVTLDEARQFARREMRFAEEQETSGWFGEGWRRDFVLAQAKRRSHSRIGAHAEVLAEGEWWKARVTDARGEEFEVFYYGYERSDREWVTEGRIRWRE